MLDGDSMNGNNADCSLLCETLGCVNFIPFLF